MIIKTQDDWWKLAIATLPLVKDYILELTDGTFSDIIDKRIEEASGYIENKNHKELYVWFHGLWSALPDREEIRVRPFFDICDLCSEYYSVFTD